MRKEEWRIIVFEVRIIPRLRSAIGMIKPLFHIRFARLAAFLGLLLVWRSSRCRCNCGSCVSYSRRTWSWRTLMAQAYRQVRWESARMSSCRLLLPRRRCKHLFEPGVLEISCSGRAHGNRRPVGSFSCSKRGEICLCASGEA